MIQLMKTRLGMEAFKLLEQPVASYLGAYQQGAKVPEPNFEESLRQFEWNLQSNDALWGAVEQKSSSWICNLAFALLLRVKTSHLRVCHRMV